MDMIFWYSIGMLVLALAIGLTLCTLGYRWSRHDGYKAGYSDGKADRTQEQLAEREAARKAPRHALTAPRREPDKTALVKSPDRITWERDETAGGPVELPGKRFAANLAARRAAVDVILPEPGSYLPQAGRDSGPGTVTMAKLELPATTGELAAVTDQYIADMAVQEETFRLGLAT